VSGSGDEDHLARPCDGGCGECGEAPSGCADSRVPLGSDRGERALERRLETAVESLDAPSLEVGNTE
jgi:hypothetical protein